MKEINFLIFSLPGKITECCPEHAEKDKTKIKQNKHTNKKKPTKQTTINQKNQNLENKIVKHTGIGWC